jgi:hypothetical protein
VYEHDGHAASLLHVLEFHAVYRDATDLRRVLWLRERSRAGQDEEKAGDS